MTTTYRYALELIADDGRSIGQVPVEPDWEPAMECAAFGAVRRGRSPAQAGAPRGLVEPLWDDGRGQPCVARFRVRIDDDPDAAVELPISYLWPQVRAASAAFVASGALQAGDVFRYRVHAFATSADAADDGDFVVVDVRTPLPIEAGPLADYLARARRWGPAADAEEFPVFIPRPALDEMLERAVAQPDVEVGGVLVGRLHRDSATASGEIFLELTTQIAARHTIAAATRLTFTPDTWAAAEAAIALRGRRELMCGWYHSHPNWCRHCPLENQRRCTHSNAFFSTDDIHLHRVCFGRAYHVALLISDNVHTGMTWSMYGWRRGLVAERGFHIIG